MRVAIRSGLLTPPPHFEAARSRTSEFKSLLCSYVSAYITFSVSREVQKKSPLKRGRLVELRSGGLSAVMKAVAAQAGITSKQLDLIVSRETEQLSLDFLFQALEGLSRYDSGVGQRMDAVIQAWRAY